VHIGPEDAPVGATLADGRRLARCLRCDTWIEHAAPGPDAAKWDDLPPVAELPKPRRGKPLQEAILMRLISINKGVHAAFFTVLAIALLVLETNIDHIHRWAQSLISKLSGPLSDTGQQASRSFLDRQAQRLFDLEPGTVKLLLALAIAYAVIEWTEAYGLWRERRWAEYLTVIATTGFLPLEVHELIERITVVRVGALIVNVALIVWLLVDKHLFGIRGGVHTLHADAEVDWDDVLAAPMPARGRVYGAPSSPSFRWWGKSNSAAG
jgi:uncharacterized membrane protein (DUF2068 family)